MEIGVRVLECAAEMFSRFGIKAVTMDDIARELGVSKKTIYNLYKNKSEILERSITEGLEKDKCMFSDGMDNQDFIDQMVYSFEHMSKMFESTSPTFFHELEKSYVRLWNKIEDYKYGYLLGAFVSNMEKGKLQGYVRPEIETEILVRARIDQVTSIYKHNHHLQGKFPIFQVQMALLDLFMHGILTEKGIKKYNKLINNNN